MSDKIEIRGPFAVVEAKPIIFEKSLTKQAFKDECDINKIMARYQKTGMLDHIRSNQPLYEDVTTVPDYHSAMIQVATVQQAFEGLSSDLRERFGNDPGRFYDFAVDPKNADQLVKWGMLLDETPPVSPEGGQGEAKPPREALDGTEGEKRSPAPPEATQGGSQQPSS